MKRFVAYLLLRFKAHLIPKDLKEEIYGIAAATLEKGGAKNYALCELLISVSYSLTGIEIKRKNFHFFFPEVYIQRPSNLDPDLNGLWFDKYKKTPRILILKRAITKLKKR